MSALAGPANAPGARRAIIVTCAMAGSVMQTLDSTIANVALPFMQGSLSASLDQVNWVLTSYIVAAAIMTAPVGWLAARFGRKRLFVTCTATFTLASVLCGMSQDLTQLVLFRLLQGAAGAALIPLSQSLVIDLYPAHERTKAQSIFGMGIMLGPIMGPTLGAWLTDQYSWHWVFLVNVPFGLIATFGLFMFMDETPPNTKLRFDWFGFAALAVGIGALQLALDRGEQVGWFESNEIIAYAIISVVGVYYFLAHSLTTPEPFIRFDLFKDRNYASSCIFMAVMAVVLFATMALVSPFLQQVAGHPVLSAGMILSSRGVGTFFAMMTIRSSMKYFEARTTMMVGLGITAYTLYLMSTFTNDTAASTIFFVGVLQGFAFGMVFVAVNTVAFLTLPDNLRTYGASFQTLIRNISSSFGISVVIAQLSEGARRSRAELGDFVNPFNDALKMPDVANIIDMSTDSGRALVDQMLNMQALIIAYANDFRLLTFFALLALPVAFIIGPTKAIFLERTQAPPPGQRPQSPPSEPAE
ncbi:DHA2 family efflux MFS transporter permease subunit [Bradyrhizobium sp. LHD-71]|uniref:DHA2 family efflux MFS transporter permease subunit n=1 Tax=Bradyrhizobium sp. LHD-71 TaxID=3072141 RepID=UPI00280D1FB5|nr:DHA2 family efflux MFS transporter permease subunit [Bradyrhizobium sp. LHD-71]MDQ8730924.1 DHA2 family efflux MFS transporter permease subunit [Bradyrhizobium sp. LHD-71]